jgi:hypothetical protein
VDELAEEQVVIRVSFHFCSILTLPPPEMCHSPSQVLGCLQSKNVSLLAINTLQISVKVTFRYFRRT